MSQYMELSDRSFGKALESPLTLVDFWGDGCGPCRMMEPVLDDIYAKYKGKMKVFRANIGNCSKTAAKYSVKCLPTILIFRGGKPVERFMGVTKGSVIGTKIDVQLTRA